MKLGLVIIIIVKHQSYLWYIISNEAASFIEVKITCTVILKKISFIDVYL